MSDPHPSRVVTAAQLRAALAALGRADVATADVGPDALIGAVLALAEAYARTQVADPAAVRAGYRDAVLRPAGGDVPVAGRTWALQLVSRLHLTAEQLRDTPAALVDVAGPASLAAANVVVLLHHAAPAPGAVAEAVTTAAANLATAQDALAQLRADLRADGFGV